MAPTGFGLLQALDRVALALERLNARFPWSHNDHFHAWILRILPARRRGAIDVGCGPGKLLAGLAGEFRHVHGTDISAQMSADASALCAGLNNIVIDSAQLGELSATTEPEPVDLITMVAVLHHLDTDETLAEAARRHLPGAQFRHRVGFRYTLEWTKPVR